MAVPTGAVERRFTYAPPQWVMFEALVEELPRWLGPCEGAVPQVVGSVRPTTVRLAPWLDPAVRSLRIELSAHGAGSALHVRAVAAAPLDDATRRRVRHGLGEVFGAALRDWVDQGF